MGVKLGLTLRKEDIELEGWKKVYDEELHNMYSLPNIIREIKSRMMMWVGHVAPMTLEMHMKFCFENLKRRDLL
jgi:hypothetical protein